MCSSHRKIKSIGSASHENGKKGMRKHNIDAYSNIIGMALNEKKANASIQY